MTSLQALTNSLSSCKIADSSSLDRLVVKNIPQIPWYKRLEMALSLALQVRELHQSGKVHGKVSLKHIFISSDDTACLKRSRKENADVCNMPEDIFLLGCTLFELIFYKTAPWRKRKYKEDELDVVHTLLEEYEFLNDEEAVKFVISWMCHSDVEKRFTIDTVILWLRRISENDHAALFPYKPVDVSIVPVELVERSPAEIGNIVETLFKGCVHNSYITRKRLKLSFKIIYLSDLIILLPKKSLDEDDQVKGAFKHGRPVRVLHKVDARWEDVPLYALSSNKEDTPHAYKGVSRKERAIRELFEKKGVLSKCISTLTFATKPDKLLCLYERSCDLFRWLDERKPDDAKKVEVAGKIIAAVNVLHKKGFVHRDLKIENLLLNPDGSIWFCDMDDAVEDILWQEYSDEVGSIHYLSPERHDPKYKGSWKPQEIYALGCTLLLLLEPENLPWEGLKGFHIIDKKNSMKGRAETERRKLCDPLIRPALGKKAVLTSLAYWMVHPELKERPTWDVVIEIANFG